MGENSSRVIVDFCCPAIETETFATQPTNRQRTLLGAGEEVILTFGEDNPTWEIVSGQGTLIPNPVMPNKATFTAYGRAGETKIRAQNNDCIDEVVFTIVEPKEMKYVCEFPDDTPNLIYHRVNRPSGGSLPALYCVPKGVSPHLVSFYNLEFKEPQVLNSDFIYTPNNISNYWLLNGPTEHNETMFVYAELSENTFVNPNGTFIGADIQVWVGNVISSSGVGKVEFSLPVIYRVRGDTEEFDDVISPSISGISSSESEGDFGERIFKGNGQEIIYFRTEIIGNQQTGHNPSNLTNWEIASPEFVEESFICE